MRNVAIFFGLFVAGIVVALAATTIFGLISGALAGKPFMGFLVGYSTVLIVAWLVGKVVAAAAFRKRVSGMSVFVFVTFAVVTLFAIAPMVDIPVDTLKSYNDAASSIVAQATRDEVTARFPEVQLRLMWAWVLASCYYTLALLL